MARYPINTPYASGTTNKLIPTTEEEIQQGIALEADIRSNLPNGLSFLEQSAIKELQNTGGLFNSNKIYQIGDFVSVLVSENGIYRILYYKCKTANLTNTPPVIGQDTGTPDIPVYSNVVEENLDDWDKILFATKTKSSFNVKNQCNVILIGASNSIGVSGKLKVKTSGANAIGYDVCFDIEFFGSASEFKISNVYYSQRVRASQGLGEYLGTDVTYIGFCLDVSDGGELHLYCFNTTFCSKIEFDYSDLNIPIIPSTTTLNMNKPYAIIEGGGVIRQGIGELIYMQRNPITAQSGENYYFFLFKNGLMEYSSATILDAQIYHQYTNGGFASTNIDPSDRVLRNTGTNAGYVLGGLVGDAIRNLTASFGALQNNGPIGIGFISNIEGQKMLTSGFAQNRRVTPQEMSQIYGTTITSFDYWESRGLTPAHVNIIELDASQQVPTANENRGKSFTSQLFLRVF